MGIARANFCSSNKSSKCSKKRRKKVRKCHSTFTTGKKLVETRANTSLSQNIKMGGREKFGTTRLAGKNGCKEQEQTTEKSTELKHAGLRTKQAALLLLSHPFQYYLLLKINDKHKDTYNCTDICDVPPSSLSLFVSLLCTV